MEDERLKIRMQFMKMPEYNPKESREKFQVSLRKKRKQDIFRKKRAIDVVTPPKATVSVDKSIREVFEELVTIVSESNWNQRITEQLKALFNLISDGKDWLELATLTQFSHTLATILKDGVQVLNDSVEDCVLVNTELVTKVYILLTMEYNSELDRFVENSCEDKIHKYLLDVLLGSLNKLIQLGSGIGQTESQHEVKYYVNL